MYRQKGQNTNDNNNNIYTDGNCKVVISYQKYKTFIKDITYRKTLKKMIPNIMVLILDGYSENSAHK